MADQHAGQEIVKQAFRHAFMKYREENGLDAEETKRKWAAMEKEEKNALIREAMRELNAPVKEQTKVDGGSDRDRVKREIEEKHADKPNSRLAALSFYCEKCRLYEFFVSTGARCIECGMSLVKKQKRVAYMVAEIPKEGGNAELE